jgi:multisubunit Na+/H+ antiporter MnhG subunit
MGLDIRIPLGLIFLVIGGIMALFGAFTHGDATLYERSLGVDLNLFWGVIMFVFGAIMFFVGKRQKWQDDPINPRPWERDTKVDPLH